ncbi:phosphorylated CTD interacting factor 1 WW domain-containing protein [Scenedesmus sp. NREL 46B-D3]|nr:phosphorylated CTD interacting factor 1 WW domain-containing protein [Scenedesmus sp. NREL 46B-D3]
MGASSRRLGRVHALLLAALLLLECSAGPVQALGRRHATAARAALQEDISSTPQKTHSIFHTPFNSEASLQIAARQRLFDYAVTEALDLLDVAAKNIKIPEYKTTLDIPVIGGIDVSVSNVNITNLQVPRELAKVAIESGYYHLKASNLTAQITFDWGWSKGPLSGSGYGELSLQGGALDEIFLVRNQESGVPQLVAVSSAVSFESLGLTIHSYSADWLYQGLLYIFSGTIKRQIEEALDGAMHTDVPGAINGLLDSLPAKVSVQGLPFDAVFTYAVYTLNYVVVKGYGEVVIDPVPPSLQNILLAPGQQQQQQQQQQQEDGATSTAAARHLTMQQQQQHQLQPALQDGACPFPASPLPLTPADIGGDASMFSLYLHEAIPNCIFWGLFNAGALHQTVQDGNIPQLRLITDLFGGLIPELPKHFSKRGMLMEIVMTEPPVASFHAGAEGGVVIAARYDTNVSVLNATGNGATVLVARLSANVSIAADFGWDATVIHGTAVNYAVSYEMFPVNVQGWNQIIEWVVKQAGPRQSLGQLWDTYVKTPATPYIGLDKVVTRAVDQWFVVSSDVKVTQLPPLLAQLRGLVPHDQRSNTATFLEGVIDYIQSLQQNNVALESELSSLRCNTQQQQQLASTSTAAAAALAAMGGQQHQQQQADNYVAGLAAAQPCGSGIGTGIGAAAAAGIGGGTGTPLSASPRAAASEAPPPLSAAGTAAAASSFSPEADMLAGPTGSTQKSSTPEQQPLPAPSGPAAFRDGQLFTSSPSLAAAMAVGLSPTAAAAAAAATAAAQSSAVPQHAGAAFRPAAAPPIAAEAGACGGQVPAQLQAAELQSVLEKALLNALQQQAQQLAAQLSQSKQLLHTRASAHGYDPPDINNRQDLCQFQPAAKWAPYAVSHSACSASPAAAVELELLRAAALDTLRHKLASLCAKAGLRNVPLLSFERWRFAAKWAEDEPQLALGAPGSSSKSSSSGRNAADPVLPFGGGLLPAPEPGLVSDLARAGLGEAAAAAVALQLAQASAEAAAALSRRRHQLASGKPASCPAVAVAFHTHSLDLTCGKSFVKVSRASYGKLARLYRTHWLTNTGQAAAAAAGCTVGLPLEEAAAALQALQTAAAAAAGTAAAASKHDAADGVADSSDDEAMDVMADSSEDEAMDGAPAQGAAGIAELEQQQQQQHPPGEAGAERAALHQRLFALLLRYKSIQGHGFQAAAGPPVFEVLRRQMALGCECFASPLNAHFSRYGSAFPDVDGPFGSAGSFFRMRPKHGSFEANPPFVPALLTATAQHVLALLQQAEAARTALSFCVLVPGWQEVAGWQMMSSSSHLRRSLVVAAADHGYCDGASHQRRDLYRQSPYDSAILFLQTTAAAAKWPVSDSLIQQLQAAMASCCPSGAAVERQRKQRGLADLEWRGLGTPVLKYEAAAEGQAGENGRQQQQHKAADMTQAKNQKDSKKKEQKKRKRSRERSVQEQQQQDEAVQQGDSQQGKRKKKQKQQA